MSETKRTNTMIVTAGGGIVLVALLVVGAMALQSRLDGPETPDDQDHASDRGWVAAESSLGRITDWVSMGDTIYALSTAPGRQAEAIQALYTSQDGETWEHLELAIGNLFVGSISGHGDTLYAIGTAPATGPGAFEVGVSASTDGGISWSEPVTLGPGQQMDGDLAAMIQGSYPGASVVAADVVVAAVSTNYSIDFLPLVPEDVLTDSVTPMAAVDGLVAIDYEIAEQIFAECLADTTKLESGCADQPMDVPEARVWEATWDELGFEPPGLGVSVFMAESGTEFEHVADIPVIGRPSVFALDDGFLMAVGSYPTELWSSPDGRRWSRVEGLPDLSSVADAGQLGDQVIVAAQDRSDDPLLLTADTVEGPWTPVYISEILPEWPDEPPGGLATASIGRSGMVLAMSRWDDATHAEVSVLARSRDGTDWSVFPATELLGTAPFYPESVLATEAGAIAKLVMQSETGISPGVMAIVTAGG